MKLAAFVGVGRMMGRFVLMLKRWWVLALVFTLALSLTSCSKKKSNQNLDVYGFDYCDGELGSFDVYTFPNNDGTYDLSVIPVDVNAGDVVQISLTNQGLTYKDMIPQVALASEEEIYVGRLTESDLDNYDILAIVKPLDGNQQIEILPNREVESDAICTIPLPEDGGLSDAANR